VHVADTVIDLIEAAEMPVVEAAVEVVLELVADQ
jgi:hypothetical protein